HGYRDGISLCLRIFGNPERAPACCREIRGLAFHACAMPGVRLSALFDEFRKFAMRGNVIDLAVGVVVGAAFTGIVNSLVKDVVSPPIGALTGGLDFTNLFLVLKGPHLAT